MLMPEGITKPMSKDRNSFYICFHPWQYEKFYLKALKHTPLCVKQLLSVKTCTGLNNLLVVISIEKVLYLYCVCCLDIMEDEFYYYRQIFQFYRRYNGHGRLTHLRRKQYCIRCKTMIRGNSGKESLEAYSPAFCSKQQ